MSVIERLMQFLIVLPLFLFFVLFAVISKNDICLLNFIDFFANLCKNFLLCKIFMSILIFLILIFVKHKKSPEKSVSLVIQDLLSAKLGKIYGILGVIFILSQIAWFADSLFAVSLDNKKGSLFILIEWLGQSFVIFLNLISFGLVFLLFYPKKTLKKRSNGELEKRKVLIMGLSYFSHFQNIDKENLIKILKSSDLDKEILKVPLKSGSNIPLNWQLPLRSIKFHSENLEKVYLLVSEKSGEKEHFNLFLECLKAVDIDISKIEKSKPVDFDDTDKIFDELSEILKKIKRKQYKDKDISVNISGGTSALTLCLTLFALEEDRQIEYFTQYEKPAKLKRFNISKEDAILFLKSLALKT